MMCSFFVTLVSCILSKPIFCNFQALGGRYNLIIYMLHSSLDSLARSRYLSDFSHFYIFSLWLSGTAKIHLVTLSSSCWLTLDLAPGPAGWLGLWHINLCRLFNAKSIFMKIVIFQTIQFRISTQFKCKYSLIMKNFYFTLFSLIKQF